MCTRISITLLAFASLCEAANPEVLTGTWDSALDFGPAHPRIGLRRVSLPANVLATWPAGFLCGARELGQQVSTVRERRARQRWTGAR
jgi:hypothetical protein